MMIETTFLKDFGYIFRKKIREKHNLLHEDKITGESRDDEIIIKVKKQRSLTDLACLVVAD